MYELSSDDTEKLKTPKKWFQCVIVCRLVYHIQEKLSHKKKKTEIQHSYKIALI